MSFSVHFNLKRKKYLKISGILKIDEIKNKFRSYQELKDEIENMNLSMHTDSELIQTAINQFNATNDRDEKIRILTDLEYYVHKVSN